MAFYNEMLNALWHIVKAPFVDLSALWVLTPIILIWIILEAYFGTHKKEQLGWNTALGNGISMFWISMQLMQHLFANKFVAFTWPKVAIVVGIMLYSIFVGYISFMHIFSSKVTYAIASPTPVYFFSGIAILWAYGSLKMGLWVAVDLVLLFGLLLGVVGILRKLLPESGQDDDSGSSGSDFGGSDFGSSGSDLGGSDDFSKGGDDFGKNDDFSDMKL